MIAFDQNNKKRPQKGAEIGSQIVSLNSHDSKIDFTNLMSPNQLKHGLAWFICH
ncbi:hypothetical protein FC84_GL000392 [Lapidilactobacillus dextrinicus DSM 20335]|uniref:Uncharacterized protein n=1 Tax=Lapidilactobacillus dextrinicus DSM 20335 TaxID=1423738 RepID=A0A0R2BH82_9LACO|nr:hypothetical protein FC84_GL000392 [Lapidilactobacillus dextrinicus DSM 20335]